MSLRGGAIASLLALAAAAAGLHSAPAHAAVGPGVVSGDTIVHDPSVLKLSDGRYYIYATTGVVTSTDRTKFSNAGAIFSSMPAGCAATTRTTSCGRRMCPSMAASI